MIISCNNCNKKFDINSDLIPDKGRLLQCSGCSYQWFFKKEVTPNIPKQPDIDVIINSENVDTTEKKKESLDIKIDRKKKEFLNDEKNLNQDHVIKNKKKYSILSLTIIFIISFAAIIILIDTFKYPLKKIIPNVEFILYNLYESFKDILLFFKDLI